MDESPNTTSLRNKFLDLIRLYLDTSDLTNTNIKVFLDQLRGRVGLTKKELITFLNDCRVNRICTEKTREFIYKCIERVINDDL